MTAVLWEQFEGKDPENPEIVPRPNSITAGRAAARLGALARWWMKPHALALSGSGMTPAKLNDLPQNAGDCWVLCVNVRPRTHGGNDPERGLLRTEFLLPLRWVRGGGHGMLPPEFTKLADGVLQTMRQSSQEVQTKLGDGPWGLRLHADPESTWLDLRELIDFQAGSGWASIAAALWCCATDSVPDPRVWATGCWRDRPGGVARVAKETLQRKVRLFREYGAEQLFVPQGQDEDVKDWLGAEAKAKAHVGRLLLSEPSPVRALGPYLAALRAEPGADAPFEERRKHYLVIHPLVAPKAKVFREQKLFPDIVHNCRQHFDIVRQRLRMPDRPYLVTIASAAPELIPLAFEATQAEKCLIFYDQGETEDGGNSFQKEAQDARAAILKHEQSCQCDACEAVKLVPFRFDDTMIDRFQTEVADFRPPGESNPVVFDLTPANKLMTGAFAQDVASPGDWLIYLTHHWRKDLRLQDPGTERFLVWPAGKRWRFEQRSWQA